MKKNGFTLVELLAVLAIMALLIVLVVPSINNSSKKTKEKAYNTKVDLIKSAAVLYGQDNYMSIVNDGSKEIIDTVEYYTKQVQVKDLVPNYVNAESDNDGEKVTDPRNSKTYLDNDYIKIKVNRNTKKVTADYCGVNKCKDGTEWQSSSGG